MQMLNPTSHTLKISELNLTVKPGGLVEIPDAYCMPRKGANTDPMKPIIAMLAPQLIPADEANVAAYKANKLTEGLQPQEPAPPSAADHVANGMAPAIAELVASGNAASVPKVTPKK